jgi:recombination protein RecA
MVEIFGPESSGKTTLALNIVANSQKMGGICAFIDAEHALDLAYARNLGVNVDDLLCHQPDSGEQALEIVDRLVQGGGISVIVVDSVAALTPKAELDGDMGDSHIGLQARLMSQAMRKLTASVSKSNVLVVFINQTRQKIGVMWGSNETTTGGTALKFYASIRLEIKRIGALKAGAGEEATIIGNKTTVRVVKNKLAPPFRKADFDIVYGKGISYEGDVLDLAVAHKLIEKSGAWFNFDGTQIGQGRENAKDFFRDNPKIAKDIAAKIKAAGYIEIKNK